MTTTPLCIDNPNNECTVCGKGLGLNDVAIVYSGGPDTTVMGSCCMGKFMSSVLQDYAELLRRYGYVQLLHTPRFADIIKACDEIKRHAAKVMD